MTFYTKKFPPNCEDKTGHNLWNASEFVSWCRGFTPTWGRLVFNSSTFAWNCAQSMKNVRDELGFSRHRNWNEVHDRSWMECPYVANWANKYSQWLRIHVHCVRNWAFEGNPWQASAVLLSRGTGSHNFMCASPHLPPAICFAGSRVWIEFAGDKEWLDVSFWASNLPASTKPPSTKSTNVKCSG